MKIGITLPNIGIPASKKAVDEISSLAEKYEFDSVWTSDHLLVGKEYTTQYGKLLESLSTLSYLAGRTEHVKLGAGVLVLPMREVVLLAKQASAIQILSNNRLLLGMGAGWNKLEFANVRATSFSDRGMYFDEGLQLLRWLMKGNAGFSGEFYDIQDGVFGPIPTKEIPIYIGGSSGQSIRRAAKLADGWFPNGASIETFRKGRGRLSSLTEKKMELLLRMTVVFAEKERSLSREALSPRGELHARLAGTSLEILEQIVEYKRAGLDHLVCYFGDRELKILKVKMRKFAEEILPSV
ncbi:MAG: TIGR03619 family F420-dependent LLM class oxidoreductase [Nitrososphaerales archaeon]